VPQPTHEVPTAPAKLPFEPLPPPPMAEPVPEEAVARTKSASLLPPMDDLDESWDMPEEDPSTKPETQNPPSSSEMAGDGAPGGDGIDEPGWD